MDDHTPNQSEPDDHITREIPYSSELDDKALRISVVGSSDVESAVGTH